jgi:hypothetical protein
MCCNKKKRGRVEFEDGWLIKSSFITKDEMKACQLTRTKIQQKKIIIIISTILSVLFSSFSIEKSRNLPPNNVYYESSI